MKRLIITLALALLLAVPVAAQVEWELEGDGGNCTADGTVLNTADADSDGDYDCPTSAITDDDSDGCYYLTDDIGSAANPEPGTCFDFDIDGDDELFHCFGYEIHVILDGDDEWAIKHQGTGSLNVGDCKIFIYAEDGDFDPNTTPTSSYVSGGILATSGPFRSNDTSVTLDMDNATHGGKNNLLYGWRMYGDLGYIELDNVDVTYNASDVGSPTTDDDFNYGYLGYIDTADNNVDGFIQNSSMIASDGLFDGIGLYITNTKGINSTTNRYYIYNNTITVDGDCNAGCDTSYSTLSNQTVRGIALGSDDTAYMQIKNNTITARGALTAYGVSAPGYSHYIHGNTINVYTDKQTNTAKGFGMLVGSATAEGSGADPSNTFQVTVQGNTITCDEGATSTGYKCSGMLLRSTESATNYKNAVRNNNVTAVFQAVRLQPGGKQWEFTGNDFEVVEGAPTQSQADYVFLISDNEWSTSGRKLDDVEFCDNTFKKDFGGYQKEALWFYEDETDGITDFDICTDTTSGEENHYYDGSNWQDITGTSTGVTVYTGSPGISYPSSSCPCYDWNN